MTSERASIADLAQQLRRPEPCVVRRWPVERLEGAPNGTLNDAYFIGRSEVGDGELGVAIRQLQPLYFRAPSGIEVVAAALPDVRLTTSTMAAVMSARPI
jgi:hypothetical protein